MCVCIFVMYACVYIVVRVCCSYMVWIYDMYFVLYGSNICLRVFFIYSFLMCVCILLFAYGSDICHVYLWCIFVLNILSCIYVYVTIFS